jgi:hypothetical protein
MKFGDDFAQKYGIGGFDRIGDFLDELRANVAILVPHREAIQHR